MMRKIKIKSGNALYETIKTIHEYGVDKKQGEAFTVFSQELMKETHAFLRASLKRSNENVEDMEHNLHLEEYKTKMRERIVKGE